MSTIKSNLGWVAAGALAAVMLTSGFQSGPEKSAVINMNDLITKSNMGTKNTEILKDAIKRRETLLSFLAANTVVKEEEANRLKVLALKEVLTEAEKKEEEQIKTAVLAAVKDFNDRNTKASPTDEDRNMLADYNRRRQVTARLISQWQDEFQLQLNDIQNQVRTAETTKAREALNEVAKKGGYTIVFENQIAPYGANDLTEEAIKALNAKP